MQKALRLYFRTESQIRYESSQQDTLVVNVATAIMIEFASNDLTPSPHRSPRAPQESF
jgi:hypothetical protein